MVRHKITPDRAEENKQVVRAVYDELKGATLDEFPTFKLDDGVST